MVQTRSIVRVQMSAPKGEMFLYTTMAAVANRNGLESRPELPTGSINILSLTEPKQTQINTYLLTPHIYSMQKPFGSKLIQMGAKYYYFRRRLQIR